MYEGVLMLLCCILLEATTASTLDISIVLFDVNKETPLIAVTLAVVWCQR